MNGLVLECDITQVVPIVIIKSRKLYRLSFRKSGDNWQYFFSSLLIHILVVVVGGYFRMEHRRQLAAYPAQDSGGTCVVRLLSASKCQGQQNACCRIGLASCAR